ncbi:unnamed protein product [Parnassius apollo]|uniref:(apollo) hypothetical protein n=1 Tax=Parnassius apollo TaxID=110799 RepID=A0A8S3WHJ1_PARAO|nr:unnamed protein product [Parnassius apollo]
MDTNGDGVVSPDELACWYAREPALLLSPQTLDTVLINEAQAFCSKVTNPSDITAPPARLSAKVRLLTEEAVPRKAKRRGQQSFSSQKTR